MAGRRFGIAIATLLALLTASGSSLAVGKKTLAVLPVEAINLEAADRLRLEQVFIKSLEKTRAFEIIAPSKLGEIKGACARDAACLARIGAANRADQIVALSVGRLGDTYIMRMAVYRTAGGTRVGSWQQVLSSISTPAVQSALQTMVTAFAPRPVQIRKVRWYQRWWVWTAASVIVAGSVTAVVLTTRGGRDPDSVIRP